MGYNSTYSGVQVDAAVAKYLALENQGGAVSSATLTNLLNNYLDKNEAETTYLSKGVAASTYLTQDNAEANYQKKADLIFHRVDYVVNPVNNVTIVGAVPWNRTLEAIGAGHWESGKFVVEEPGIYLATFSCYSNANTTGRATVWKETTNGSVGQACMINGDYGDVTGFFNCAVGEKLCAGGYPTWSNGIQFYAGSGHNTFLITRVVATAASSSSSAGAISGNQSLTGLSIGVATPDFTSNALEVSGAAKFNGPILTSWNGAKAIGSYGTTVADPAAFINQVRYSNGLMGSVCFNGGTTWNGVSCNNHWYNYIWVPHRFGGDGYGGSSGDNCNYGTLLLFPMTFNGSNFRVRFAGGNVAEIATF